MILAAPLEGKWVGVLDRPAAYWLSSSRTVW